MVLYDNPGRTSALADVLPGVFMQQLGVLAVWDLSNGGDDAELLHDAQVIVTVPFLSLSEFMPCSKGSGVVTRKGNPERGWHSESNEQ